MFNSYFFVILTFFLLGFILDLTVDFINYFHTTRRKEITSNDEVTQRRTVEYFKANFRLSLLSNIFSGLLVLVLLFTGALGKLSDLLSGATASEIMHGILFFGILGLAADILFLPFSIYRIFTIEERFGFNRVTAKIYISDKIKSWIVALLIGGGLYAFITWVYKTNPGSFWLIAWIAVTSFMILAAMFFTSVLLPLFNKLTPVEEGSLKSKIEAFCAKTGFPLARLYMMDGSKRSTKANAFFSGLGARKTIVLYDTLVKNYSEEEIVAVLAHEIGHYKLKHTIRTLILSVVQTGVMFFILSRFLGSTELAQALGGTTPDFHLCLTGFALLYSPVSQILGIGMNALSRKHEYEADAYAKEHYNGTDLSTALRKLHKDSLSNPDPHPVYVFMHYSHPTLEQRVKRLVS